jgi:hypothetical protein
MVDQSDPLLIREPDGFRTFVHLAPKTPGPTTLKNAMPTNRLVRNHILQLQQPQGWNRRYLLQSGTQNRTLAVAWAAVCRKAVG